MALSWEEFTATAGQTTVAVNIAYLDKSDIHLEVNDVEVTGFTWSSDTLITVPSTTTLVVGDKLAIIRKTDRTALRLLFSEGAAFTRDNIDEQNDQFLYLAQELVEGRSIDGFYGDISMNGYKITQLGAPEDDADAANKAYVDASTEGLEVRTVRVSSGALNPIRGSLKGTVLGFDSTGQPVTFKNAGASTELAQELGDVDGFKLVGQVQQFSDLANITPEAVGQQILLQSYYSGMSMGGGVFEARASTGYTNDYGRVVVVGSFAWVRTDDVDKLTAAMYGALPVETSDGFDSTIALQRYLLAVSNFASPIYGVGANVPAGTYNIGNIDLSNTSTSYPFRLAGAGHYEHGRQTATMLQLTGANDTYGITVNSHIVELTNIGVNGGYAKAANTRRFITSKTRPTWLRVSKFYVGYMGGVTWDFLDSLDTKLDQFYTEYTYDSILKVLPSETAAGGWTISTAIELSNFNIQYHTGGSSAKPAILAPLSYYGLIDNGWIEHTDYPANIAYGMWTIRSLAIESTTYPVYAYLARLRDEWGDYKLATPIDTTLGAAEVAALNLTIPSWVSDARFANAGIIEQPSFHWNKGATAQHLILPDSRIANGNGWYYLGVFSPRYTAHGMVIELQGANGYGRDNTDKTTTTGAGAGTGKAIIRIQNKGSTSLPAVAWHAEGSSGITAVSWKYLNSSTYQIAVYVKIQQYSNSIGMFVRSDSDAPTYQNGVVSYYTFSGAAVSDISAVTDLTSASAIVTLHNNTYGFGMNLNTGYMMFDTPVTYAEGTSGQTRVIPVINNGQRYNIPLSANGTRVPVYTKTTLPDATGTNSYSLIVVTNGTTTNTPCVAYSNGTTWLRVQDNTSMT